MKRYTYSSAYNNTLSRTEFTIWQSDTGYRITEYLRTTAYEWRVKEIVAGLNELEKLRARRRREAAARRAAVAS